MSTEEFDLRLSRIEDQAAAMRERLTAYEDQEFAREFDRTGWPHETIARHLSKRWKKKVNRDWVTKRLRFGRFLNSLDSTESNEIHVPDDLTERAFRGLWSATEPGGNYGGKGAYSKAAIEDEQRRFREVAAMLAGPEPQDDEKYPYPIDEKGSANLRQLVMVSAALEAAQASMEANPLPPGTRVNGQHTATFLEAVLQEQDAETDGKATEESTGKRGKRRKGPSLVPVGVRWAMKRRAVTAEELNEKFGTGVEHWGQYLRIFAELPACSITILPAVKEGRTVIRPARYRVTPAVRFVLPGREEGTLPQDFHAAVKELLDEAREALKLDSGSTSVNWSPSQRGEYLHKLIKVLGAFANG